MPVAEFNVPLADPEFDAPDKLYEVVDGVAVEQPDISAYSHLIAYFLCRQLQDAAVRGRHGLALTEMLYRLKDDPLLERRPDVSFVSRERLAGNRPPALGAWEIVPDLAVEVLCPSNKMHEIDAKVLDYLDAGVRQVWVLFPDTRRMYIHSSRSEVRVIGEHAPLSGGDVLPGLAGTLAEVFASVDALG